MQAYGFVSYALMANKEEAKGLQPILDKEELIRPQIEDYKVTIAAANACDKDVACWIGKLKDKDKIVVRKATTMLARYGRGNPEVVSALAQLLGDADLEVRNEALSAADFAAPTGSDVVVKRIDQLEAREAGRSIWNNFKREALPVRSRLINRAAT